MDAKLFISINVKEQLMICSN